MKTLNKEIVEKLEELAEWLPIKDKDHFKIQKMENILNQLLQIEQILKGLYIEFYKSTAWKR